MTTPTRQHQHDRESPQSSGSPPDEPRRASGPDRQSTMPPRRTWLWFALILLANFLLVRFLFPGPGQPVEVPTPSSRRRSGRGTSRLSTARGTPSKEALRKSSHLPAQGGGSEPDAPPSRTSKTFTTVLPSFVDPGLEELLIDNGVEISAEPYKRRGLWQTLLFAFGPALLLIEGLHLAL